MSSNARCRPASPTVGSKANRSSTVWEPGKSSEPWALLCLDSLELQPRTQTFETCFPRSPETGEKLSRTLQTARASSHSHHEGSGDMRADKTQSFEPLVFIEEEFETGTKKGGAPWDSGPGSGVWGPGSGSNSTHHRCVSLGKSQNLSCLSFLIRKTGIILAITSLVLKAIVNIVVLF